ncbi:MAG: AsmA family protein [Reyranellaceae bacterium]
MRKLLYALLGLVGLILAAAIAVPLLVDVNDYKAEILAEVGKRTGRDMTIEGPLKLGLLPSPEVTARDVRLANLPGSADADMARIGSLRISVAFLPLLSGRLDVTQVSFVDARIVLERGADGRANWQFGKEADGAASNGKSGGSEDSIAVRDVSIEDSTLVLRDAVSGTNLQFDRLNGRVRADTLQGPFDARLAFESRGIPVKAELRTGDLRAPEQPIGVLLETQAGRLQFDGTAGNLQTAPVLKGKLKSAGADFAALVAALASAAGREPTPLPPAFGQKFELEAAVVADAQSVAATGVRLNLGGESGSGDVALRLGEVPRVDVKFAFAKLDFDQLLSARGAGAPAASGDTPKPATEPASGAAAGLPLRQVEGSLDLSVGTIVYQGRTAQQVAVKADLAKGVMTLHSLGGQFPGNTQISAAGTVDASKAQPSGGGKVEVKSARLREFLSWLNVDVSRVPADRLNALEFTGQIAATAEGNVQIANAVAKLDSTTAKGAVTLRTAPRLGVVADLDIDSVNVDAYLPPPADAGKPSPPADAGKSAPPADAGKPAAAGGAEKAPPAAGTAATPGVDATIKARVARLIYQGHQIEGVNLDVTVADDKLTFRSSRVANLAGSNVAWNGTVADFAGNPRVDLALDLQTQDVERLLKLAGVAPPAKQRIGALSAQGRIAGRPQDLTFNNFAVTALGSTVRLTGKLASTAQGATYNFSRLELRSDDADRLLAAFGIASPLPGRKLGALTATGSAQGSASQATVDLDLANQGAAFDVKGSVANLGASPTLAMDVGVSHPNFQRFMQLLLPGYGGGAGVGAIRLNARVDGNPERELRISNLRGMLGQSAISGAVTANLAGAVPDIAVTLETGLLEIDRILPLGDRADLQPGPRHYPPNVVPAGVQLAQATARAGRFSRTPIDVSALRSFNARIDLKSQALSAPPWRVENAVGQMTLRDGVLNVGQLSGRAFDGDFHLTGALNAARLPASLNASLKATQIDMGRLSRALAQKDRFDGRMNVALELTSAGSSEADLAAALNGRGSLNGKLRLNTSFAETAGGLLAGQAAQQLDKLLGNLMGNKNASLGGGDLKAAINVVLARFANRDGDASGTLAIRNGVITSNDLRVVGNRARAETQMTASLPAWRLDATTNVLLDENPQEPYLIVVNRGPLDDPSLSISRGKGRAQDEPAQQQPTRQQQSDQQQPGQMQQSPQQQSPQQQSPQQQQQQKPKKPNLKDLLKKF